MTGTLLRAAGLGQTYRDVIALEALDMTLSRGESVALLGPNGAGKTTLLTILAGVFEGTAGTSDWDDTKVGWVPQRPALYRRLTTRENLTLFAALEGADRPGERAEELIERADLGEYAERPASALSTGTLQRLNFSIALAGQPSALLLDEPTAALSPDQRIRLWSWLAQLRLDLDLAIIFSTQSVDEAVRQSDRLIVLARGRCVFDGTSAELAPGAEDDAGVAEAAFLALVGGGS